MTVSDFALQKSCFVQSPQIFEKWLASQKKLEQTGLNQYPALKSSIFETSPSTRDRMC